MTKRREGSTQTRTSRFGVYLDEATHTALLRRALDEKTSGSELVERLIRAYLKKGHAPKG